MKLKEGFVIRNVAGENLLIAIGKNTSSFGGSAVLNDVSAFILNSMKEEITKEELLELILNKYEVTKELASTDLDNILDKFKQLNIVE